MSASDHHRKLIELDPEALRCPHVHLAAIREEAPVHYVPELDYFMVTRYEDIVESVRNTDLFSNQSAASPEGLEQMYAAVVESLGAEEVAQLMARRNELSVAVLLGADPPLHTRQRALVSRAFSPRRIAAMEPRIREIADELVDAFIGDGRVELVSQFGVGLPLIVIAEALGVSRDDLTTFKRWSDEFVLFIGNPKLTPERMLDMVRTQMEFYEYFTERIEERRAERRDDLISDVIDARLDGQELTMPEMLGMFSQFLVAGNETTTMLLSSAMLLLLTHPDQLQLVLDDHSLIPGVVEEALRLETPVQGLFRVAKADTEIAGVPIPAGSKVMMCYAAGNRDPQEFPEPDTFDVQRANAKLHLSFGQGPHYCIGASLSRAEGRIGLEVLLSRLHDIRLAPENRLEYGESYILHRLNELHLVFTPG